MFHFIPKVLDGVNTLYRPAKFFNTKLERLFLYGHGFTLDKLPGTGLGCAAILPQGPFGTAGHMTFCRDKNLLSIIYSTLQGYSLNYHSLTVRSNILSWHDCLLYQNMFVTSITLAFQTTSESFVSIVPIKSLFLVMEL